MKQNEFVRVCVGGTETMDYPKQRMATLENLRNIYAKGCPALSQSVIDTYNMHTKEINCATWHETREQLLNNRHKYYVYEMQAQIAERDKTKIF